MLRFLSPVMRFTSSKYFYDDKYTNLSLYSENKIGSLSHIAQHFSKLGIDMVFVKSQLCNAWTKNKKYVLNVSIMKQNQERLNQLQHILSTYGVEMEKNSPIQVPWFPKTISDLNLIGQTLLEVKDEVNKDHLQFSDPEYRERRNFIANVAQQYRMGQSIPDVPYTKEETELWKSIFQKLRGLHRNSMSQRYEVQMKKLQKQFMMSQRIPQLNELNTYLRNKTGFTLKPTHGILSQREFLNAFAFRVFCCTQYIRHHKTPEYTPEPDIVHEIVGHVPMFADPDVAELSHQIGLMSLGASDKQIAQLGALYWYTLEFGVCKEGSRKLGYGAGIASSIGEIEHLTSDKARFKKFEPTIDCDEPYPIQSVQPLYRVTEDFNEALRDLEIFGHNIIKPITTTFNFQQNTIEYDRNIQCKDLGDEGPKF